MQYLYVLKIKYFFDKTIFEFIILGQNHPEYDPNIA